MHCIGTSAADVRLNARDGLEGRVGRAEWPAGPERRARAGAGCSISRFGTLHVQRRPTSERAREDHRAVLCVCIGERARQAAD